MWIPSGDYLTVEEYRKRLGYAKKLSIYTRLKRHDIPGAINFYGIWLLPAYSILTDHRITNGNCIAWRRKRVKDDE
jgi:hypothetical protein